MTMAGRSCCSSGKASMLPGSRNSHLPMGQNIKADTSGNFTVCGGKSPWRNRSGICKLAFFKSLCAMFVRGYIP